MKIAGLMLPAGLVVLLSSLFFVYLNLLGATLGPVNGAKLVVPLAGAFVGSSLILLAYYSSSFSSRKERIIVLVVVVLPVGAIGLLAGFQAVYIAASPLFENLAIIKRDIILDDGWYFPDSNSRHPVADGNVRTCLKHLDADRLTPTLEVTSHYGKVSYFRVLRYGDCKVEFPMRNPNQIVPPYVPGEVDA